MYGAARASDIRVTIEIGIAIVTLLSIIVASYILLCPLGDAVLAKWGPDPTGGLGDMHARANLPMLPPRGEN